jgi:hypothetical protein
MARYRDSFTFFFFYDNVSGRCNTFILVTSIALHLLVHGSWRWFRNRFPSREQLFNKIRTSIGDRREINCVKQETSLLIYQERILTPEMEIFLRILILLNGVSTIFRPVIRASHPEPEMRKRFDWWIGARGPAPDSYSRSTRFESLSEHRLSWLKFFVIFLGPSRQMRDTF